MTDDTDSDWDSSMLDFSVTPRGPRVIGFNQQPPKEMDAIEEASEHSREDQHRPKKGTKPCTYVCCDQTSWYCVYFPWLKNV